MLMEYCNIERTRNMFEWFDKNPTKSIISYTILIIGSVFAFAKFSLIENVERYYKEQIAIKEATIAQHEAKINFLEIENNNLQNEVDKYLGWLQSTPGTLQFLESENEKLLEKIETGITSEKSDEGDVENKNTWSYDAIEENTAILDSKTGIVVSMKDISVRYDGSLSITIPGKEMEIINNVSAGFTKEIKIGNETYQLIVTVIDYITGTYSIIIKKM